MLGAGPPSLIKHAGGDAALAGFVACRKRAPFFVRSWSLATDDRDASDGAAAASVHPYDASPDSEWLRDGDTPHAVGATRTTGSLTFDAVDAS